MGMKAKVGLLALLIATVAGAIAFDKFRARTTSTTDQAEPRQSDTPAAPEVAATPTGKGGLTPVKEIVAAPPAKKPEPPKPVAPAPPAKKPEPPAPPSPSDFLKAEPPRPRDPWRPSDSDPTAKREPAPPVETVKEPPRPPVTTPSTPSVEVVNRTEQPKPSASSGLSPADVVRPPDATASKPPSPSVEPPAPLVPSAPIAPDTYEIEVGDSFYVISQKVFGTPRHWRAIRDANPEMPEDRLVVGKKVRIPKIAAAPPAPTPAEAGPAAPPSELAGKRTHIVKPGDNLSTISKLYYKQSRFWRKIQEANSRVLPDEHSLSVGMVLVIPEIETAPAPAVTAPPAIETPAAPELGGKKIHVVAPGEVLSTISQKYFGSTKHWKAIYEANKGTLETPDDLRVGQRLVIPEIATPPAPSPGTPEAPKAPSIDLKLSELGTPYTVQEGDTLTSIAERLLGSPNEWGKIFKLNKGVTMRDENSLSVGMVIVIPPSAEKPVTAPPKAPEARPEPPKPPARPAAKTEEPALRKVPEPPKKDGSSTSKGTSLID